MRDFSLAWENIVAVLIPISGHSCEDMLLTWREVAKRTTDDLSPVHCRIVIAKDRVTEAISRAHLGSTLLWSFSGSFFRQAAF